MLAITRILLLLLTIILALICNSLQAETATFQPIFNQDENLRKTKSSEILRSMNLKVNPCEDFYEYVCGNYEQHHHQQPHVAGVATMENILADKISGELQKLLEEQVTVHDGTSGRKVKDFYKSCIVAEHNGPAQESYFSQFIKENGGFPAVLGSNWHVHHHNYNWQQVVGQLRLRYDMEILIGMQVDINYQNMYENSIYLGEPSSLIPRVLCSAEGTKLVDIREREYEHIEKEVAEKLINWLTLKSDDAKKLAADIVTFEFELCTAMQASSLDSSAEDEMRLNYSRKTLDEFTNQFNGTIDFNQFVSTSLNHAIYKPVFMRSEQYFWQLIKTIQQNNIATIANYIMYRALSYLAFPLDDHANRRPKYCIKLVKQHFPKVLGDMYLRQYGSNSAKIDVETIYKKISESFKQSLHSGWIEESTIRLGKQKLEDIKLKFPSYEKIQLKNLQIDSDKYWQNLDQVLAQVQRREFDRLYENGTPKPRIEMESYEQRLQYRRIQHQIDIAWGAMKAPFYQSYYPNSMKYALIGVQLARELSVAFDDIGWSSDRLGISNWDRFTAQKYANRSECFRKQTSNYLYNNPAQFYNSTEMRQIIATSSAVNIAFKAYLTWLSYMSPNNDHSTLIKETLPGLNLSNTQLFFVSFAQLHCRRSKAAIKQKPLRSYMPMELHTRERYAVNGPLRNCAEFARDFSCLTGTEMHPIDKCVIY